MDNKHCGAEQDERFLRIEDWPFREERCLASEIAWSGVFGLNR